MTYGWHGFLSAPDDRGPPQCDRCGDDVHDPDNEGKQIGDGFYCDYCAERIHEDEAEDEATMPSRTFLVRQATLTAMHKRFPASIRFYGLKPWGEKLIGLVRDDFQIGREFCGAVRCEFNALVARCNQP